MYRLLSAGSERKAMLGSREGQGGGCHEGPLSRPLPSQWEPPSPCRRHCSTPGPEHPLTSHMHAAPPPPSSPSFRGRRFTYSVTYSGPWRTGSAGRRTRSVSHPPHAGVRARGTSTGHAHGARARGTSTGYAHWPRALATSTGHAHSACALITSTGHAHWAHARGTRTGHDHGARPRGTRTGHAHGARTWGTSTGHAWDAVLPANSVSQGRSPGLPETGEDMEAQRGGVTFPRPHSSCGVWRPVCTGRWATGPHAFPISPQPCSRSGSGRDE